MSVLQIILSVLVILFALMMIILFLVQEGNDRGLGVVAGSNTNTDSFYSKTKGRTLEERLKKYTMIVAICFAVCSTILYLAVSRGW